MLSPTPLAHLQRVKLTVNALQVGYVSLGGRILSSQAPSVLVPLVLSQYKGLSCLVWPCLCNQPIKYPFTYTTSQ